MLLTFFTVLLAWTVARIVHRPQKKGSYALLTAVIFCGMMTQYYFVFYAFFICAAYDIYALAQKRYRSFVWFSLCALAGVGLMICAFPACLKQMFEGNGQAVGGMSVADALLDGKSKTHAQRNDMDGCSSRHMPAALPAKGGEGLARKENPARGAGSPLTASGNVHSDGIDCPSAGTGTAIYL